MPENRKLKVFLCHSKDDKPKVRELYHRLVADGFDAWLDEEKLLPGQEWEWEIRKAVREVDAVVVCLSNGSVTKAGYVQKEIRFALDVADEQPEGAVYLIPVKLEDCKVPDSLNKWQWVNLFIEEGYQKLENSLYLRANALGLQHQIYFPREVKGLPFEPIMMMILTGEFLMGSTQEQAEQVIKSGADINDVEQEQPRHTVKLSEYLIGKYPITNREYQVFVRDAKYNPPFGWNGDQFPPEKVEYPVVDVSWNDATAYCKWLSEKSGKQYRLPTEAEWEKAARGENGYMYPWGNEFDPKKANTYEANLGGTSEVGQFSPQGDSPYGCADMIGNVWEWCKDWYDENEYKGRKYKVTEEPQGSQKGSMHVFRGGSFHDVYVDTRCAFRRKGDPDLSSGVLGFRVASPTSELKIPDKI